MTISKFIAKEKLLLLLLIIMLMNPFYYGYRIAILFFFVLFFQVDFTMKLLDKNVFYLFLFGALFQINTANRIDSENSSIVSFLPDIFLPSILYLIGKLVSTKYQFVDILIFFLFFIMFFFSVIPIISIMEQVISYGFVGIRSLYLIWNNNALISATVLGSYFSINMAAIALLNSPTKNINQKRITFFIFVIFVLSLICILRLGNRTQLFITPVAISLSFLFNYRYLSKLSAFIQILTFIVAVGFVIYLFAVQSEYIYFFQDRLDNEQYGFLEGGGRFTKWGQAIESIFTDPLGWKLSKFGYAHNLWLDVVRVSGIFSLIPLILFSISSFKIFFKSLGRIKKEKFLSTFIFAYFISIIIMFFVEPIMDGMYLLFLVFCLFIGFLSGIIFSNFKFYHN